MSKYLLDTHAWFWLAVGDDRISKDVVQTIDAALSDGRVFLTQISLWEIALKVSMGKIRINRPIALWLKDNAEGLVLLDLPIDVVVEATQLPGTFHRDPADRFIVGTARNQNLTLVTGDELIIAYAKSGHVDVLDL